jgi:hypothetical protein
MARVEIGNHSRRAIGEEPIAALQEETGIATRNRRRHLTRVERKSRRAKYAAVKEGLGIAKRIRIGKTN